MLKTLKKGNMSAMECADVAAFIFTTWQIRSCLLCKLILPEAMVINLFAILRVFLWVSANEANSLAVSLHWVKRFEEKLNNCQGKQEHARTCNV